MGNTWEFIWEYGKILNYKGDFMRFEDYELLKELEDNINKIEQSISNLQSIGGFDSFIYDLQNMQVNLKYEFERLLNE